VKPRTVFLALLPLAGFLLTWQVLADQRWINTALFPSPGQIAASMAALMTEYEDGRSVLAMHVFTTGKRLAAAAMEGIVIGMTGGCLLAVSRWFYRLANPFILLILPIPGIAMAPLFIVWLGFGDQVIITIGAVTTFFPVAYNTYAGIRSVNPQIVHAASIMGAGPLRILVQVYLPWAAVYILNGIKLGLARCWRTVVAVEFIAAADWGLGYMIWDAAEHLNASVVYGGIFLLALLFVILEKGLINGIARLTVNRWGFSLS